MNLPQWLLGQCVISPSTTAVLSLWDRVANWFKIYETDLDDSRLKYALDRVPESGWVWIGILSECCKHRSDTIRWGDKAQELFGFADRLKVSIPKVNEAINALSEIEYIKVANGFIKVLIWNEKQSEYCIRKKRGDYSKSRRVSDNIGYSPLEERRGEENRIEKSTPKASAPVVAVGSEHQAFIKGWTDNFKEFHGDMYAFGGGRDAKAVKELLRHGILRIDLLEIAKSAWKRAREDRFASACKRAATIHGFHSAINDIRTELNNGKHQQQPNSAVLKPNPRGAGVCKSVTDYGKSVPRLQMLREQAEASAKTALAEQVVANGSDTSASRDGPGQTL